MKGISFASLRTRLFSLVLIALIPALGIVLYSGLERRESDRQEALAGALKLAQEISRDHDHLIRNARQILLTLSKISQVQQQDKAACSGIFAQIMQQSEGLRALIAVKPNGDIFASSRSITRAVNFSDRPWFQRLLRTRDFVIGEYLIGRVTDKPLIALAYPVTDKRGKLKAILSLGMDLDWLKQTIVKSQLPEGTCVSAVDSNGTILFRHPDAEKFMGKPVPEASITKAILEKREGVEEAVGLDGVPRLFGFTSLGKGVESVHVSVGIPRKVALAKAEQGLKRNLAYLGLIALLALAAAWFMGELFIVAPVNRLVEVTKKLTNGDLTARTGASSKQGEIGLLARAFDQMAESLERRETEKKRIEEALRRNEEEAKGLAEENATIAEIGKIISSTLNIEEVYERFAAEVGELVPLDRIGITIESPKNDGLVVAYTAGIDITGRQSGDILPSTGTVAGECLRTRSSFLFQAESIDELPSQFPHLLSGFRAGLRSMMSVPLISRDKAVGVLSLFSAQSKAYTERDLGIIQRVGNQIAGAIANALLSAERKRAEEELQQSEERFRKVFEESQIGIVLTGPDFRFHLVNPAFCAMLGYDKQELLALTIGDITHAEHVSQDLGGVAALWRGEIASYRTEKRYVRKNDDIVWGSLVASLIRDSEGRPLYALEMIEDITERKLAYEKLRNSEEKLRESKEFLDKTFASLTDAILIVDPSNATILAANSSVKQIFGYSSDDVIGRATEFLYTDREDFLKFGRQLFPALDRCGKFETQYKMRRKDGSIFPTENIVTQVLDPAGKRSHVINVIRDITERKQAEKALQESEEKFRDMYDNAPVGYREYDSEGRITSVNRADLEMLGYDREEMVGHFTWEFVVEEEDAHQLILGKLAGAVPPSRGLERTYRRKDGTTLPVLIEDRPILDEEGRIKGMRSTIQDITKRKQMEQEKASLEEQLLQSQKMEAVGRLAGGIAHDFNNLLTVIRGYAQLSLLELSEGAPLWGNINQIQKSADRAAGLTRQLLAFSRRQVLETKVLDLNTLLKDLDKMMRRIIGEDIELVSHLSGDLGRIKADPGQIEQVVMNLAVNSRDAIRAGGKLTIETSNILLDEAYARTHAGVLPGRYVMLALSDTGVGMTSEIRERIFEPFFTTKEKGKGTGLGLSVVYGIVKQSGGYIWVNSQPGEGTIVRIYFPQVDELLEELGAKNGEKDFLPRGETILVVEDAKEVRRLTVRILEKQGYTVLAASTGKEAMSVFKEHKEPINLLLTDIVMPGMSGPELAESLTSFHPEMKVLFMSGYADNAIANNGILREGTNYIQKPFTVEGLIRKIREVLVKS